MNLFSVMDLSGSALRAERVRAEVTATNMANAETTRTADGGPYLRKNVVFASNDAATFRSTLMNSSLGSIGGQQFGMGNADAQVAGGVRVESVESDAQATVKRYDPGHPDADADGYVSYPDINPLTEMVDLMGATRAYGLNATALQAEKAMLTTSLDILK